MSDVSFTGASSQPMYRFGLFSLDPTARVLTRSGLRIKLQDQPFQLLLLLVENSGHLVSREDIRRHLWPENTFVDFDKSLGVAVLKAREALGDTADNPRFIETVPRRGYRFIAPVSVENRESPRPVTPEENPAANPLVAKVELPSGATQRSPLYWAISLFILLLVGFGIYILRSRHFLSAIPPSATVGQVSVPLEVKVRRSVAVLGFRNLAGRPDEEWLSTAFSEMLNTELAAGGELRLVSGEDVARAKRDLSLTAESTLAKTTLDRLRINPGTDVVVLGSYTLLPDKGKNRIRLDIRLQSTDAGETIVEQAFTGDEDNLFELASEAGARLRESLGLGMSLASATGVTRASLPANQRAIQFYTEGRNKLWAFELMSARDLLLKAVAADPKYPMAHSVLSQAWNLLGYTLKARAEAKRALDLSRELPQEEALIIQGRYYETINDSANAIETYQKLFNMFPDRLEYGLRLAGAQHLVKPADALRTLAVLRNLPSPLGNDPRIDLMEAATVVEKDLPRARAAAERAIARATAEGSPLIVARGYGFLCQQASGVGVSAQAIQECENARQSYIAAGDKNNAARTENDLAATYYEQGNLAKAAAMWQEAIKEFQKVGDPQGLAAASNNLGDTLLVQGNLKDARKLLEQALPSYQALEDKDGVARALVDLGEISVQAGDLTTAKKNYERATAIASEIDDKSASAYSLQGLGEVLMNQGDLTASRKFYKEALELHKEVGEKQAVAETQIELDHLSIEEGHAAEVEAEIRQCKAQFHQDQQADDELTASYVLLHALLVQSKDEEARKEIDATTKLAQENENRLVRLQYDLQSARFLLDSNDPGASRSPLQKVLKEANTYGYIGVRFEALLALAELENKTGHSDTAHVQIASLKHSASNQGFGLIAHKAESLH
jgi:DNA-binding winged helix-turn-helix (wHTH) protein/tetratricopeptide (TPR) repeat protein